MLFKAILAMVMVALIMVGFHMLSVETASGHDRCRIGFGIGKPTEVRVSDVGRDSATVHWTNSKPDVHQARIELLQSPVLVSHVYVDAGIGSHSYTYTGLEEGETYQIRVHLHEHADGFAGTTCGPGILTGSFTASSASPTITISQQGDAAFIVLAVLGALVIVFLALIIRRRRQPST